MSAGYDLIVILAESQGFATDSGGYIDTASRAKQGCWEPAP
jgi:hypothetical protein